MSKLDINQLRRKLRELQLELNDCFRDQGQCCGLTLSQCHTLLEIGYQKEASLVSLASRLGLDSSTLSRTINGLVFLGLVNRSTDEKDRRYIVVSLTPQGQQAFERIESFFNDYFTQVLELIPADKRESVSEAVSLLADAVREFSRRGFCCPDSMSVEMKGNSDDRPKTPKADC